MIKARKMTEADQSPHRFDPDILREYDIRGTTGVNLGPADAFAAGCAFGTTVRRGKTGSGPALVIVGRDGRLSSPDLLEALTAGLLTTGVSVEDIGLGPTPMLYFAVRDRMADGGVMVTGSHNPAQDNGFKMTLQSGPLFGEAVRDIGALAQRGDYEAGDGTLRAVDVQDAYVQRLLQDFDCARPLKVAWDAGNGAAGAILHRLVSRLPGEHILMYDEVDGRFPNHHPDPTVDGNLDALRRTVLEQGCDLGIAFDGDADRIGVVDEAGRIVRADTLLAIYAREVLAAYPGAPVIGDVKCSSALFDEIARLGGKPVLWKSGHSPIKSKMAELRAPLAGELSGHIFFADRYYGFDDGLYCAVRLLQELADHDGPLSGLYEHLPRYFNTPELRIGIDEHRKFDLVREIADSLRARSGEGLEVLELDGVRVNTPEGWWLLRASNTQNAVTARVEGASPEALARLKAMLTDEIAKTGETLDLQSAQDQNSQN